MNRPNTRRLPALALALATGLATTLPDTALAAGPVRGAAPSRLNRQDTRSMRSVKPAPAAAPGAVAAEAEPPFLLTLGLAHDTAPGDDRSTTTPFDFSYTRSGTTVGISGDGATRHCGAGAACTNGLADLYLSVETGVGPGLKAMLEVGVPTGGSAGSSVASQQLRLQWDHDFSDALALRLRTGATHLNAADDGASRYVRSASAMVSWTVRKHWVASALWARSLQPGAVPAGSTDVAASLDFPLGPPASRYKPEGSLALTRGISPGARHTAIGFDVTWAF